MKKNHKQFPKAYKYFLFLGMSVTLLFGIYAQGPLRMAYNNITARFNAFFYANQIILDIENDLQENYNWNYSKILPVYPLFDTVFSNSHKTKLEDVIKKASLSIQRHPGSKWEFDCYILVGKARFYGSEFPDAIEAFKYVNTKSENRHERYRALVELIRTFTEAREYENALAVIDFLKKEKPNRENLLRLYLNKAYLFQHLKDEQRTVGNLVSAEVLIPDGSYKARIDFIIGQLYQSLGLESESYKFYRNVIKNNPSYELSFYTKLNMSQVTKIKKGKERKKIEKYFRKLLKDPKNIEYKDKIYYELASFELKQGNLEKAIEYYKSSTSSSTNNERQKAYSFHKLSQIYYDSLSNYQLAKVYYDSTLSILPKDEENYGEIAKRRDVLSEFVKYYTTLQTNDSLLRLSNLSPASLTQITNEYIISQQDAFEKEKISKNKKRKKSIGRTSGFQNFDPDQAQMISTSSAGDGNWYFYEVSEVSRGSSEFQRKWGRRELNDNWRRKNRIQLSTIAETSIAEGKKTTGDDPMETKEVDKFDVENTRKTFLSSIPTNERDKERLLKEIEEAYYQLGNIYNFKLQEQSNAILTFEKLVNRFDSSEHRAEVLYELFLIYQEEDSVKATLKAERLSREYPESIYTKLILNPNYREENLEMNKTVSKLYSKAYDLYLKGSHNESLTIIDSTLAAYEKSKTHDNLRLLKVLNFGQNSDIYKYQYELSNFLNTAEDSTLRDYASELLRLAEEHQVNLISSSKGRFQKSNFEPHHFLLVYEFDDRLRKDIYGHLEAFIEDNSMKNEVATIRLNKKYGTVIALGFHNGQASEGFRKFFVKQSNIKNIIKGKNVHLLSISKDNFDELFKSKDLNSYLNFFIKNYP